MSINPEIPQCVAAGRPSESISQYGDNGFITVTDLLEVKSNELREPTRHDCYLATSLMGRMETICQQDSNFRRGGRNTSLIRPWP